MKTNSPLQKEALGLYLHIPFCQSKCAYCDFYSTAGTPADFDRYQSALLAHLASYASLCTHHTIDTLYFGGGTPSLWGEKRIAKTIRFIRRHFSLDDGAEITVECNPESTTPAFLKQLRKAGVNRLSIGVQSAQAEDLQRLGRIHSFETARTCVEQAQNLGFSNISLDMMYGLPYQTTAQMLETLESLLELSPTHLSCYALKLEPHAPMLQKHYTYPDADTQADMYEAICKRLSEAGFVHYEISNWAKPSFASRHNQKYWDFSAYLGIGASAHSYFGGKRFSFVAPWQSYCDKVLSKQENLVEEIDDAPLAERATEYIMLRLRTAEGISESHFHKLFQKEFTPYVQKLEALQKHGFTAPTTGGWRLTEQGFLVSNTILTDLFSISPNHEEAL